jgi:hypothetical protein
MTSIYMKGGNIHGIINGAPTPYYRYMSRLDEHAEVLYDASIK